VSEQRLRINPFGRTAHPSYSGAADESNNYREAVSIDHDSCLYGSTFQIGGDFGELAEGGSIFFKSAD